MTAAATGATPTPQPASDNGAARLLVIELFFLAVGLAILAFLGYLFWTARRDRKKGNP